jgi:hypothetical protein
MDTVIFCCKRQPTWSVGNYDAKIDLDPPNADTPISRYNADTIKKLEDFSFGKQKGFIALVDGDTSQVEAGVVPFARKSLEQYPGRKVYWVDLETVISRYDLPETVANLDKIFGQISPELLDMTDLPSVLAYADGGSDFVEAIVQAINSKAKVQWIVIINGLTKLAENFFCHDVPNHDFIRFPKVFLQGSIIITSQEQPILPESLGLHRITLGVDLLRGAYDAPDADYPFDNVLNAGALEIAQPRVQMERYH